MKITVSVRKKYSIRSFWCSITQWYKYEWCTYPIKWLLNILGSTEYKKPTKLADELKCHCSLTFPFWSIFFFLFFFFSFFFWGGNFELPAGMITLVVAVLYVALVGDVLRPVRCRPRSVVRPREQQNSSLLPQAVVSLQACQLEVVCRGRSEEKKSKIYLKYSLKQSSEQFTPSMEWRNFTR